MARWIRLVAAAVLLLAFLGRCFGAEVHKRMEDAMAAGGIDPSTMRPADHARRLPARSDGHDPAEVETDGAADDEKVRVPRHFHEANGPGSAPTHVEHARQEL